MLEVLAFVSSGLNPGDNMLKAIMEIGGASFALLGAFKFLGGMLSMDNRENADGKTKMVWGGMTAVCAGLVAGAAFNFGGMGFIQ